MPRQFTFNGEVVVGAKRPLWNPIINRNRNEVGKPKFNSNKYAEQGDRTYGTLVKRDPESAGDIIFNWKPTPEPKRELDHGRDFIKLNKMSVSSGASKPHEVSIYRGEHDARLITRPGDILRLKNQVPVNIDKNKVYGTPSESQEFSMSELVRHKFEDEWVKEQLAREETLRKRREKKEELRKASPLRVRAVPSPFANYTYTRSNLSPSPTASAAANFSMKKFQKIPSRLASLNLTRTTPEPEDAAKQATTGSSP